MEENNAKCGMCIRKYAPTEKMALFLCFECEILVCVNCVRDHKWHEGMIVEGKEKEGIREKRGSERVKENCGKRRIAKKLWNDIMNESEAEIKEKFYTNNLIINDRAKIEHEGDTKKCWITGICGLGNTRWLVCDSSNSCIKIFKLGLHILQRYIRFRGVNHKPWDITEIYNSDMSETGQVDPAQQFLIAVTLPWARQIIFLDLSEKPALKRKVINTEIECWAIQSYKEKIFTICNENHLGSPFYYVYVKSMDGHTLHKFNTGSNDYPVPYLAVVSGRIYLTDRLKHRVQCRTVSGRVLSEIIIKDSWPKGISVDQDNNVYLCAWGHKKVYLLDAYLTRYKSVLDQPVDYLNVPKAICCHRNKLFVSHDGSTSLDNFVSVIRLL